MSLKVEFQAQTTSRIALRRFGLFPINSTKSFESSSVLNSLSEITSDSGLLPLPAQAAKAHGIGLAAVECANNIRIE
jgi:hypothetical protein